jgi:hypothetical protein
MAKLTDTQLTLLARAAQRRDRLLALPEPLPPATKAAATKLLRAEPFEEITAPRKASVWRTKDEQPLALRITAAGLVAIGIDETDVEEISTPKSTAASRRSKRGSKARRPTVHAAALATPSSPMQSTTVPARTDTKQARILDLLRRGTGVTLAEMMEATGWQGHSVRGFLSAVVKKKLSLPIVSEKGADGERRYHIAALAAAEQR